MKKLHIIYTGGTIGGECDPNADVIQEDIKPKSFMALLSKKFPDLKDTAAISYETPVKKFSENISPLDWVAIARSAYKAASSGVDGIVIPHGTDTMSYTAAALSYLLQGLKIPVVLTGSNYPFAYPKTDADRNLSDAIRVTLEGDMNGVFLVFSGIYDKPSTIHLGTRVRKIRFYDACFKSVNTEPIGQIKKNFWTTKHSIEIINRSLLETIQQRNRNAEFLLKDNIDENIYFIKTHPGYDISRAIAGINSKPPRALLLELYNSGTGCVEGKNSLLFLLEHVNEKLKIPVFVTSQNEGTVTMDTYMSSKKLRDVGAIPLRDMTTEGAIPKLMWCLGQKREKDEIVKLMLTDIAGEIAYDKR